MSETPLGECPTLATIEQSLEDNAPDTAVRDHLLDCARCRKTVEELRENNRLLEAIRSDLRGAASGSSPVRGRDPEALPAVPGYRLLEEISRGGQAILYRAVQVATGRCVAVKVLGSSAFGGDVQRRRFEREIELVAGLEHPHIVTVYDSGETRSGDPFFSMHFVQGVTLDRWCAARWREGGASRETLREFLVLFEKVCEAVHFAHQHGVIHRDLKPSNILVDGEGTPHVVDFGIATSVRGGDDPRWKVTQEGAFLGTLAYASPEQLRRGAVAVDVRSDVYALGVILYEALSGRLPGGEDGSSTSSGVPTSVLGESSPPPSTAAADRRRGALLDDDLDRVVLKALAIDPAERYASAAALGDDLRRCRVGEPVEAKADRRLYVLGKLIRRHALPIGIAAMFLLLLIGSSAALLLMYQRAVAETEKVRQINLFLEDTLGSIEPASAGGDATVRDLLDEASRWVDIALSNQPEVESAIRAIVGNSYRNIGAYESAERELGIALRLRRQTHGETHIEVASGLSEMALLRRDQGRLDAAAELFEQSLAMRREIAGDASPEVAYALANLGLLRMEQARFEEARSLLEESLAVRRRLFGDEHGDVAMCLFQLAELSQRQGELDTAVTLHRQALAMRRRVLHGRHPDLGRSLEALGRALLARGESAEAHAVIEECLRVRIDTYGEDHARVRDTRRMLAALEGR